MVRAKPEVAGKTAKSKEHLAVTRIKKLEKRVAKLEKEKEEDRRHAKLWKANYLKEQRDFEERAWRFFLTGEEMTWRQKFLQLWRRGYLS